jgi:glycosyltransferase involved in cell wall biosynthesis
MPEVGPITSKQKIIPALRNEKLKICWSGLHIPRKSLNLLIEVLSNSFHKDGIELHIIGEGPCTKKWKKYANKLKLDNLQWYGWVKREKAVTIMQSCHIFAITSLSDANSTVLMEALSVGLPVIALNHLGFANIVNDTCGIKIPIHSKKQVVTDFAKAIDFLFENDDVRVDLAYGALRRAQDFTWEKKAEIINEIYNRVINHETV